MIKLQGKSKIINCDECIPVIREGAVQFVDGKPVKSGLTEFTIKCNVQPLGGRDLMMVPEGDRNKEQYWVWTETALNLNDRIVRCGVNFQVQTSEPWGSFFQARIMKIDVGVYAPN